MKSYIDKHNLRVFFWMKMAIVSNHKTSANKFNDQFSNASKKLLENMGGTNNKFQHYFRNRNEHNLLVKEADPGEVNK